MKDVRIRESILAGTWYPGTPDSLRRDIDKYLEDAKPPTIEGEIKGLLAPHAGYYYSGAVAAYAYKLLEKEHFQRVIVLAPSHRASFRGISIGHMEGYRTPLGVVPVDRDLIERLRAASPLVKHHPEAEAQEHSLEIQLPFLQVVLNDFKLIPLIMGDNSFSLCEELAALLFEVCRHDRTLLVASTDLSHFHSYEEAKAIDSLVLKKVESFDPQGLHQNLRDKHCEACGAGPMITVMMTARKLGADGAKVIHYANSGDVTGDKRSVVGYMAGVIYKSAKSSKTSTKLTQDSSPSSDGLSTGAALTEDEKTILHGLAMESIRSHCHGIPTSEVPSLTPSLSEHRGAFVSIHKGQDLRGCIGMIEASQPLNKTVQKMAVQAAFNDPRFKGLSPSELDEIDIEISILTPLKRVDDVEKIQVGKHGLYIRKGHRAGILLPQVATEHGWNRTQFLEYTCRKAGLPSDSWKDEETEIHAFTADVFQGKKPGESKGVKHG